MRATKTDSLAVRKVSFDDAWCITGKNETHQFMLQYIEIVINWPPYNETIYIGVVTDF